MKTCEWKARAEADRLLEEIRKLDADDDEEEDEPSSSSSSSSSSDAAPLAALKRRRGNRDAGDID